MAVTAVWHVNSRVEKALNYVMNPEKTTEKPELAPEAVAARKAVGDVIVYAENSEKTEQMMYVTGINCTPESALEEFMNTKRYWGKTDGRLAYHGYQSFKEGEGEITAEMAHEIGVKLAQELWGDRFEVIVATHLNTGHYHNHLIVNSVSFMDGLKYRRTKADYRLMRIVNDRLCKEYNLNIVKSNSHTRGKSYAEWRDEKQGKKTVRGTIRDDIDYAISQSRSEREFAGTMKELGYEFKFYKPDGTPYEHPGLKPPGAKGYFRFRGLGQNYEYDSIRRRIIENTTVPGTPLLVEKTSSPAFNPRPNETALSSQYRLYVIRLFSYSKKSRRTKREYIPYALREDIAKLDQYIEQMDFLYQHKIGDTISLQSKKDALLSDLKHQIVERRKLYTVKERAERQNDSTLLMQAKKEISDISRKIHDIRKEIALCDVVAVSSDRVAQCLEDLSKKPELDKPKSKSEQKKRIVHKKQDMTL